MSPVSGRFGVLLALVAIVAGVTATPASAAWQTGGPGSAYAKATQLGPGSPSIGAEMCSGVLSKTATVAVTWPAVANADSYELRWSLHSSMASATVVSPATAPTSVAVALGLLGLSSATVYVQVRAKRQNWVGEYTPSPAQQSVSCPLL